MLSSRGYRGLHSLSGDVHECESIRKESRTFESRTAPRGVRDEIGMLLRDVKKLLLFYNRIYFTTLNFYSQRYTRVDITRYPYINCLTLKWSFASYEIQRENVRSSRYRFAKTFIDPSTWIFNVTFHPSCVLLRNSRIDRRIGAIEELLELLAPSVRLPTHQLLAFLQLGHPGQGFAPKPGSSLSMRAARRECASGYERNLLLAAIQVSITNYYILTHEHTTEALRHLLHVFLMS